METAQTTPTTERLRISRLRARAKDSCITVELTDGQKFTIEKVAIIPRDRTDIKWAKARVDQCGVGIIPAKPEDIRFIASDVLCLVDPEFAEAEIKRHFESASAIGGNLRKRRLHCGLSIGELAELSNIDGLTIARMEAGYPVFPPTTVWKAVHAMDARMAQQRG